MKKDERLFLQDILSRIEQIERFTAEGKTAFFTSDMIQEAVIRCFEVIGEAVKQLTPTTRALQPELPWGDYAGFRDVLIHQYDRIALPKVWDAVENDLKPLKAAAQFILTRLEADS